MIKGTFFLKDLSKNYLLNLMSVIIYILTQRYFTMKIYKYVSVYSAANPNDSGSVLHHYTTERTIDDSFCLLSYSLKLKQQPPRLQVCFQLPVTYSHHITDFHFDFKVITLLHSAITYRECYII